ncbi:hypothetical protein HMPREF9946_00920 [Acetobacteraceae bacterium AT-5844]|nr:hypothetical protein HMPREF9946_00920 [Acetobacteraceae bacterium AT-5844]
MPGSTSTSSTTRARLTRYHQPGRGGCVNGRLCSLRHHRCRSIYKTRF